MYECFPGGLKSPRIVQEASNEATILTLVAQGMGVGFVVETARWRCPDGVAILKVADLKLSLPLALVWRKDKLVPAARQICGRRGEFGEAWEALTSRVRSPYPLFGS